MSGSPSWKYPESFERVSRVQEGKEYRVAFFKAKMLFFMPISAESAFKVLITQGIFPSALRRNIRTRADLDQNLLPTYLSLEDTALPQVFDTLCVYRFASILQMLN